MSRTPRPEVVAAQAKALAATVQTEIGQRIGNVAIELSLAAGQVLRDDYGWSGDQVKAFMDKLAARAQANRKEFERQTDAAA